MNKQSKEVKDKAFLLAASYFLAGWPDDWSADRLRRALAQDGDEYSEADAALIDHVDFLSFRHLHPMDDPALELYEMIEDLASGILNFNKES